jgi:hypothetical protein
MLLSESMRKYFIGNCSIPEMIQKQIQFQRDMAAVERALPGWEFFKCLYAKFTNQEYKTPLRYDINSFARFLSALNLWHIDVTLFAHLLNYLSTCSQEEIHNLETIGLQDYSFLQDIKYRAIKKNSSAIKTYIRNKYPDSHITFKLSDVVAVVPVKNDLLTLIESYKDDSLGYIPQSRDCDDFALLFKAHMSRIGLGNVTCGIAVGNFIEHNGHLRAHAVNICVYHSAGTLHHILYEPQTESGFLAEDDNDVDIIFKDHTVRYKAIELTFVMI